MGAYAASKFAVTAYSQQLRLELTETGFHVLLVCPGPIVRDEPRSEADERDALRGKLPARAYQPGAGVHTKLLSPEGLADEIVRACESRRPELIRPRKARLLFALSQLSPRLGIGLLNLLPHAIYAWEPDVNTPCYWLLRGLRRTANAGAHQDA